MAKPNSAFPRPAHAYANAGGEQGQKHRQTCKVSKLHEPRTHKEPENERTTDTVMKQSRFRAGRESTHGIEDRRLPLLARRMTRDAIKLRSDNWRFVVENFKGDHNRGIKIEFTTDG